MFWSFINNQKNSNKNKSSEEIDLSLEKLYDHYQHFFKQEHLNDEFADQVKQKVDEYFNSAKTNAPNESFSMDNLTEAISKFDYSYVQGYDKCSYNLIKHCKSINYLSILLDFYNSILSRLEFPKYFNISLITPIIKDKKKPSNDPNNLRPISLSNTFAQIFERLILIKSPELVSTHQNQFGFKKFTSCNHAIFVVKETIAYYLDKNTDLTLASLDAEKAFDKLWRNGLFLKLINKLTPR
ncbi:unnamed protein product, partial [Brachionus calyciflorus]